MSRARKNPDDSKAIWFAIGGAALGVGLVYLFTRPSSSAAVAASAPGAAPGPVTVLPSQGVVFQQVPADVRIMVGDGQTVVPMRAGQTLAVAPPSSANNWTWGPMQSTVVSAGLLSMDANVRDLGEQTDGTYHLTAMSPGSNVVTLYDKQSGISDRFTLVVTA